VRSSESLLQKFLLLLCVIWALGYLVSLSDSVFDEYLKTTGKPIEASIRGELSGDFEKLMLAVGMS
jgi:hypothetical protein